MCLIENFKNEIKKSKVIKSSDFFLKYRNDMNYFYFTNDIISYKNAYSLEKEEREAVVIEYNPKDYSPDRRLFVRDSKTQELKWVDPQNATPKFHKTKETRERIYLLSDDKMTFLHRLMDTYIIVNPKNKKIIPINTSILNIEEPLIKSIISYVHLEHIISIPSLGFIYLGKPKEYQIGIASIDLHHPNGEIKDKIIIIIIIIIIIKTSEDLYKQLLELTEIEL